MPNSIPWHSSVPLLQATREQRGAEIQEDDITWIPLVSEVDNLVVKEMKFVKQDLPLVNPHCCNQSLLAFNSWNDLHNSHWH